MIKLTPILLALVYGVGMYMISAFRTRRELDSKSTELVDPRLNTELQKLAGALDLDRIKVNVYEIEPVNGLAAPDGRIFITRGFYNRYRQGSVSAQEMASVIAHELGHVALGHTRKRMIDFSGQNALRTALAVFLSRFLPGIGVLIANGLATLLAARMSRADEFEADAYASALLVQAGIGTGPQKSLFHKLDDLTKSPTGKTPAWMLSHPKSDVRIAAIEKNEVKWGLIQP